MREEARMEEVLSSRSAPRRPLRQRSTSGRLLPRVLLAAVTLALVAAGRNWAFSRLPSTVGQSTAARGGRGRRRGAVSRAASASGAQLKHKAQRQRQKAFIPTEEAPFLNQAEQPLTLSPDGVRTARFEFGEKGLLLRVEAAPNFGPKGTVASVASARDIVERVALVPPEKLGNVGVRDLFWLDDRCFLITGYEGRTDRYRGWLADLKSDKATPISLPSQDASLFVPVGVDDRPLIRRDERGQAEVLLGFNSNDEYSTEKRTWNWFSASSGDLVDAAVDKELPTSLWREAILSDWGDIETVMLVNGSVHRRTPDGWFCLGTNTLAAREGEEVFARVQSLLLREHLVSSGPDYGVYALDMLGPRTGLPQVVPSWEELAVGLSQERRDNLPADPAELAEWVLDQSRARQTTALVLMTAEEGATAQPVFVHPFADVKSVGVWVDSRSKRPVAVTTEDLRPQVHALEPAGGALLEALRTHLPSAVYLGGVRMGTEEMEPQKVYRHGERWLIAYSHPLLDEPLVLPALAQAGSVDWVGDTSLPSRIGALSAAAVPLQPRIEGHRLQLGEHDVPVYLVLPGKEDPAALVVCVHDSGQSQRDFWGANSVDAWLLSRGYGVLKVNYRGTPSFGRVWTSAAPEEEDDGGFLDDIAAATRWALEERQVLAGVREAGQPPPVAILGNYFGGYAALQGMLHHHGSLFACGIAVAPTQALPWWPDSHVPTAEVRQRVEALRRDPGSGLAEDPAAAALAPAAHVEKLRELPLLLVEFERDGADAQGDLLQLLAPLGSSPSAWPKDLSFVQYAGEGRGGGTFRQNSIDRYRRIDAFLYKHLSPLTSGESELRQEPFVAELPWVSSALIQQTHGDLSKVSRSIESGFEECVKYQNAKQGRQAESFPDLYVVPKGKARAAGFSGGTAKTKASKRQALVAPASRLAVKEDGTMEVHVALGREPEGLHVLLSEIWLHVRAKGLGFTVALPRQPLREEKVIVSRLPDAGSYVFEVRGDPNVGAVENYNKWAAAGRDATILSMLRPEDIAGAPVVVPTDIL